MADELLDNAVAHRNRTGNGQMRDDTPRKLDKTERTRPSAIKLGQPADEAGGFKNHITDIDECARADGGDDGNTFRCIENKGPCFAVEWAQDFGFGKPNEIASVYDVIRQAVEQLSPLRRLWNACRDRPQCIHRLACRRHIVALGCIGSVLAQVLDRCKPPQGHQFPQDDCSESSKGYHRHTKCRPAKPVGSRKKRADQVFRPDADGEGNKNAERAEQYPAERPALALRRFKGGIEDFKLCRLIVRQIENISLWSDLLQILHSARAPWLLLL
ncbi:hypothetical protein DK59_2769 [Brucella abortus bv. 4 str. 292]|nr:hypothetical protein DK47_3122 [Brucella abortus 2308]KFJ66363.1 hypothetical protein DK59_2769 [Brucella abortus bv. 4 str. 292]